MPETAETIAKALGGRKVGGGWVARCPAHDDRTPSLSLRAADSGKVLVHCHAGCTQESVITALQKHSLWAETSLRASLQTAAHTPTRAKPDRQDASRTKAAIDIWRASQPAERTLVETYLRSRGLIIPMPLSIRFHAGLMHPSGGIWPAMVALVAKRAEGAPVAIHRTYLARKGGGKAPIEPQKMMFGPCRGGAVRLGEPKDILMVGEGIETCLAAMQATGHAAWAALSTSGLRTLELPQRVRDVIVLADGDEAGEAASQNCARRWKREGRRVRIARPPIGMDFNDMMKR